MRKTITNTQLIEGLSEKQRLAFYKGTADEQQRAIEYLRLKFDLENNDALLSALRQRETTPTKDLVAMLLGRRTSEKKAKAARENGKKGGRPKTITNITTNTMEHVHTWEAQMSTEEDGKGNSLWGKIDACAECFALRNTDTGEITL